jgi:hypothetical protein
LTQSVTIYQTWAIALARSAGERGRNQVASSGDRRRRFATPGDQILSFRNAEPVGQALRWLMVTIETTAIAIATLVEEMK